MDAAGAVYDLSVNGQNLQIEVRGTGPVILLLHGWSLDRRMWLPQVEALAENYCVVAVDRRGFGNSSAPPDLDMELDDILAVLQYLGVASCALIGMSQGGRIALRFAHKYPEKLWGLVLQSAPLDGFFPLPNEKDLIPTGLYSDLAKSGRMEEMKEMWSKHPLMLCNDPFTLDLKEKMLKDYEARDLLLTNEAPAAQAPALASELERIKTPALIINGEYDTDWLHLVGRALDYGLPNSSRLVIPGAGHLANLSHSSEFNRAVRSFLEECPHST